MCKIEQFTISCVMITYMIKTTMASVLVYNYNGKFYMLISVFVYVYVIKRLRGCYTPDF